RARRAALALTGGQRVPRRRRRHRRTLNLADALDHPVPLARLEQLIELVVRVANPDAVQERRHPATPGSDHALVIDGMAQGHPGGVREPDLDRAPVDERSDLLAREHRLPCANRRGDPLIDEDDLPRPGPAEQLVEDALPCRTGAAVWPAGGADPQDPGGADRVERA